MTLVFIPKVVVVAVVLGLLGHWMLGSLVGFTARLLGDLAGYGR
jgi:flagellar biosynthesis protein FliQ